MGTGLVAGVKDLIPEGGALGSLIHRDLGSIGTVGNME